MWFSYKTLLQNYAGCRRKSYKIMKIKMSATLVKAKLDTEDIKSSNLVAVRDMTVPSISAVVIIVISIERMYQT